MRIHHLPIAGLPEEWPKDDLGDPDLSEGLPLPHMHGRAHAYLCRVWAVGRAALAGGRWEVQWGHWQPDAHGAWASLIMSLEELSEIAACAGDVQVLPHVAIALERLDRRGVRPAGDLVVVGRDQLWWYWPEMASALDPVEACARLNASRSDRSIE